jgi:16S rRNA (adenine1518-N6/adenine1519-N6)-dimethyltransferase
MWHSSMTLEKRLNDLLLKYSITPDSKLDQNFLIDENVIKKLVEYGNITENDNVLEIGAGVGFLTEEIAKKAKKVISFEVDVRFKNILLQIQGPVKFIFEEAYHYLNSSGRQKVGTIQKVISNMPFSFIQPLLHQFTNWGPSEMIWLTSASFVDKVNTDPIFSAYFKAKLLEKVPKTAFFPQPKTISAIIKIKKIEDPIETKNYGVFIRRQLYKQEDKKLRNALREGLINSSWLIDEKRMTKNEARKIINSFNIDESELEKLTAHILPETYFTIAEKVNNLMKSKQIK